jgi:flagellar protein FliO/FliZ
LSFGAFRVFFVAFIACAGLFFISIPHVFAQDAPVEDPITAAERALPLWEGGTATAAAQTAGSVSSVFRVLLTLALAAAAIYGVVYFIRRSSRRLEARDPFLKILASAPLGTNRAVHIVAVGSKAWLVGAAENGVSLISEIEDKDTLNALLLEDSRRSAEASPGKLPDFKTMLRRLGMPVDSSAPGAENIRKRRERLRGLK